MISIRGLCFVHGQEQTKIVVGGSGKPSPAVDFGNGILLQFCATSRSTSRQDPLSSSLLAIDEDASLHPLVEPVSDMMIKLNGAAKMFQETPFT
ncbi:hypothetical protein MTR_6g028000 [Medicago truncatula]|uniref:Uncharacterized protein n=1 Tax=Medicago truncatula TaxID=3880 RepID=A0A072UID6_MEDTR|nr:hypothetical protein MTR_6g028000 [Medicago truncatula]